MTDETWGSWIEHDGSGCPCKGMYVRTERRDGRVVEGVAGQRNSHNVWDWYDQPADWSHDKVIRYRIRRLSSMQHLIRIAQNPAPMPEEVMV